MNELQVNKPALTGKLSFKHKLMIRAFGELLIWLGNTIKSVQTYEKLNQLVNRGGEAEEKFQQFEDKYSTEMDELEEGLQNKKWLG